MLVVILTCLASVLSAVHATERPIIGILTQVIVIIVIFVIIVIIIIIIVIIIIIMMIISIMKINLTLFRINDIRAIVKTLTNARTGIFFAATTVSTQVNICQQVPSTMIGSESVIVLCSQIIKWRYS